jgi:cytidyltransferase-like protein
LVQDARASAPEQKLVKRLMVDMSASLLHHGHIRLLKRAKELGHVIVALTTDDEIFKHKGYKPELSYEERKELLLALKYVDEVVPSGWLIDQEYIKKHNADVLFHGDDNANNVEQVETFARTQGVSSAQLRERAVVSLTTLANSKKVLFTPGPTNLHGESIRAIRPVFTRGDDEYAALEKRVLQKVLARAGQEVITCMQGSATTAIEVATSNFLYGNVLVVTAGYYSERIARMLERKKDLLQLKSLAVLTYDEFIKQSGTLSGFDWIVAVSTETADAFLTDIRILKRAADKMKAKLMIDATGSINLEDHHELADACMFSSCKGLGGLTGAAFITYNKDLLERMNTCPKEFILDIRTYIEKQTTGPAHTLCSLDGIADNFTELGARVRLSQGIFSSKFKNFLLRSTNQPALCTKIKATKIIMPPGSVSYQPRSIEPGHAVICHLFDQFAANRAVGEIYDQIVISD